MYQDIKLGSAEYISICWAIGKHEYRHPGPIEVMDIFGVEPEWALKQRVKYFQGLTRKLEGRKDQIVTLLNNMTCETFRLLNNNEIEELDAEILKNKKSITFIKKQIKIYKAKDSNIDNENYVPPVVQITAEDIKEHVKIKDLLLNAGIRIERGNKFKAVWRNDNNPSCDFNETKNVFCDRGVGNEGGSVIDLYMKLYGCELPRALKELSRLC